MKRTALISTLAAALMTIGATTAAFSESAHGFEQFVGAWSGEGFVHLSKGGIERVRCQGAYTPGGADTLNLALACASDSLKVQFTSEMVRQEERLQGNWHEATFGVSGTLEGQIQADRIDAVVRGLGVSARLSLGVRGKTQTVSLAAQSSEFSGTTNVILHRR